MRIVFFQLLDDCLPAEPALLLKQGDHGGRCRCEALEIELLVLVIITVRLAAEKEDLWFFLIDPLDHVIEIGTSLDDLGLVLPGIQMNGTQGVGKELNDQGAMMVTVLLLEVALQVGR